MPGKAICSADIVILFVYIPGYVDCVLASSGSNWFSYVDGEVLIDWSRGKLRILLWSWCY
jgi:hypothetical protein